MLLLIAIAAGFLMPLQTAINSRLRIFLGSPLPAALVSFSSGVGILALVLLATSGPKITLSLLAGAAGAPPWQWLGGLLGAAMVATSIFAFPRIGSVETALWPLLGSVSASLAVDAFGSFDARVRPLTALRLLGAIAVLLGVALASGALAPTRRPATRIDNPRILRRSNPWPWRLLALVAGAGGGVQGAINGALGQGIGSPIGASFVSFFTGTLALALVHVCLSISRRAREAGDREELRPARGQCGPWWMWLGGLLGAGFVTVMTVTVPIIGAGPANVASFAGLSISSLAVDRFGWLGAARKDIRPLQLLGAALVLVGVLGVQLG